MYWKVQEKVVFSLIMVPVVSFQIGFVSLIGEISTSTVCILGGTNIFVFLLMILYARWVWKSSSFLQAFLKVILYEIVLITLSIAARYYVNYM